MGLYSQFYGICPILHGVCWVILWQHPAVKEHFSYFQSFTWTLLNPALLPAFNNNYSSELVITRFAPSRYFCFREQHFPPSSVCVSHSEWVQPSLGFRRRRPEMEILFFYLHINLGTYTSRFLSACYGCCNSYFHIILADSE